MPATYAIRPLAVISIVDQLSKPNYALQVADIEAWEQKHGRIPEGSVVFVRSDWSKAWPDPKLATLKEFPGVGLEALKFLHNERKILFHGHEPLDTNSTPNLEGEHWLMHHGYAQAEGVANLDQVPETGALVSSAIRNSAAGSAAMRGISRSVRPTGRTAHHRRAGCAIAEIRQAVALRCGGRQARSVIFRRQRPRCSTPRTGA